MIEKNIFLYLFISFISWKYSCEVLCIGAEILCLHSSPGFIKTYLISSLRALEGHPPFTSRGRKTWILQNYKSTLQVELFSCNSNIESGSGRISVGLVKEEWWNFPDIPPSIDELVQSIETLLFLFPISGFLPPEKSISITCCADSLL